MSYITLLSVQSMDIVFSQGHLGNTIRQNTQSPSWSPPPRPPGTELSAGPSPLPITGLSWSRFRPTADSTSAGAFWWPPSGCWRQRTAWMDKSKSDNGPHLPVKQLTIRQVRHHRSSIDRSLIIYKTRSRIRSIALVWSGWKMLWFGVDRRSVSSFNWLYMIS